ncbi:MAG: hypoxanthine phosphoribosyltransferase [bacterium]|nr:hypoxanthine phosphoribosyltransferase [bacterium]
MKILLTENQIQSKIKELAKSIDDFLIKNKRNENDIPVFISVLTGSIFFFSDLIKNIKSEIIVDYLKVSSYSGDTTTYNVKILKDIEIDIKDKIVFIVEDIVDTGLTLKKIIEFLKDREPRILKICSLLDKPSKRLVKVKVDYKGFEIPPEFVVGYGLDYNELYRNTPYIFIYEQQNE